MSPLGLIKVIEVSIHAWHGEGRNIPHWAFLIQEGLFTTSELLQLLKEEPWVAFCLTKCSCWHLSYRVKIRTINCQSEYLYFLYSKSPVVALGYRPKSENLVYIYCSSNQSTSQQAHLRLKQEMSIRKGKALGVSGFPLVLIENSWLQGLSLQSRRYIPTTPSALFVFSHFGEGTLWRSIA